MKIKMKIEQPGYNRYNGGTHYNVTSFLMSHSEKTARKVGRLNQYGENVFTSSRGGYSYARREEDPVFANLAKKLDKIIFTNEWDEKYKKFYAEMCFKYFDGDVTLLISKESGYTLNGRRINKSVLLSILSRVVYRSCFVRSRDILRPYLRDLLEVPPNVRWALENRTPYYFFSEDSDNPYRRDKVEVMINTRRISRTSCALEISENIWGEIAVSDLDKFLNVYRMNQARSKKWLHISPSHLWKELFGNSPTESQYALMIAWLKQNRTEDMVENRAKALMDELHEEHEGVHVFKFLDKQMMFVRGNLCDWVLVENGAAKSSPQRVSIYCFHEDERLMRVLGSKTVHKNYTTKFFNGKLRGPICVNNSVGNVSLGDQFASRAFTLMNDKLAFKMVSTLKGYTPDSLWEDNQPTGKQNRIDFDALKKWVEDGCKVVDEKLEEGAMFK